MTIKRKTFSMHIVMNITVVQQAAAALKACGSFQSLSCAWVAGEPQQHGLATWQLMKKTTEGKQQILGKKSSPFLSH